MSSQTMGTSTKPSGRAVIHATVIQSESIGSFLPPLARSMFHAVPPVPPTRVDFPGVRTAPHAIVPGLAKHQEPLGSKAGGEHDLVDVQMIAPALHAAMLGA